MSETKQWFTAPVAILIGAVLIAGSVLYIGSGNRQAAIGDQGGNDQPSRIENYESLVSPDSPALGSADAPVTIVEFSDFQCPYCRSFWLSTYPQLKKDYIDSGKVRLVFRDFPLSFHDAAKASALAGQCAQEQGKFWELHDELFARQMEREADPTRVAVTISYNEDDIRAWARDAGLDGSAFDTCLQEQRYAERVQNDLDAGQQAGVEGTPTFFVNGIPLIGAQPFSVFKQAIESEL